MLFWSNVHVPATEQPAYREIDVPVPWARAWGESLLESVTKPESTAAPLPYQWPSALIAAWSPAGLESQLPASETPLVPNCRRSKPTLLGVLNQWRRVSVKSVMRVSARRV